MACKHRQFCACDSSGGRASYGAIRPRLRQGMRQRRRREQTERHNPWHPPPVTPNEPASFRVALLGSVRNVRIARNELTLVSRALGRASGECTVRLRPARRLLRNTPRRFRLQVLVQATDSAGITQTPRPDGPRPPLSRPRLTVSPCPAQCRRGGTPGGMARNWIRPGRWRTRRVRRAAVARGVASARLGPRRSARRSGPAAAPCRSRCRIRR
jgi:hypothetical protein